MGMTFGLKGIIPQARNPLFMFLPMKLWIKTFCGDAAMYSVHTVLYAWLKAQIQYDPEVEDNGMCVVGDIIYMYGIICCSLQDIK